ncbi:multidrug resistance protein homolog 49-like [Amphibalanus amphitrite]|uniref:multidrug resistance protein homolog 49-like n=1 Tax=Amphibalanus amphitrite TaxID=1232801 RepID=UPI001C901F30|nr:multidrug resistance protein homolog 49-like [Amphibalanus amphitrite]
MAPREEDTVNENGSIKSFAGLAKHDTVCDAEGLELKEISKSPKNDAPPPVAYWQLFRYADRTDRALVAGGLVCAVLSSICLPAMVVLLGLLTNAFVGFHAAAALNDTAPEALSNRTVSRPLELLVPDGAAPETFSQHVWVFLVGSCVAGSLQATFGALFVFCLDFSSARQVKRIRGLFLQAVLRQEISWFETNGAGDFATRATEDLAKVQAGIDDKLGIFVFMVSVFVISMCNAFYHGWRLTLVILTAVPVLVAILAAIAKAQSTLMQRATAGYSRAGDVAAEIISAIRTVVAFGGQQKEVDRYSGCLLAARRWWLLNSALTGLGAGLAWCVVFACYSLAFWYGTALVLDGEYDPASLTIVFFSVVMGAIQLGQSALHLSSFSEARGAAASIFAVIERRSQIDPLGESGETPPTVAGRLEFRDVRFSYPSRPDVQVLDSLNLTIPAGQTVALVGPSGCGKSTCVQLLQRLYDPDHGQVLLDGRRVSDLRVSWLRGVLLDGRRVSDLRVSWLRGQLAVVSQEPVLFPVSIRENIRYGRPGCSEAELERAARTAQAWPFISALPAGLDTTVGGRGGQLSGGQRQRVALARALLADPAVLLLDEATSALDTATEARLLTALAEERSGRTTLVVAHRLSTVRAADSIVVLREGRVAERGSHQQLMDRRGLYHRLVSAQALADDATAPPDGVDPSPEPPRRRRRPASRTVSISSEPAEDEQPASLAEVVGQVAATGLGRAHGSVRRRSLRRRSVAVPAEGEPVYPAVSMWRLVRLSGPEWPFVLLGVLASAVCGCAIPVYALFFGDVLANLAESDRQLAQEKADFYSVVFLMVGLGLGTAMFLQSAMFGIAGLRLTARLRRLTMAAILRQEMAFFDDPVNSVGALCSRLATDSSNIHGACGPRLGTVAQAVSTLAFSVTVAAYLSWRLALVLAPFVPLVLVACYLQTALTTGQQLTQMAAVDSGSGTVVEALRNIRTVAALRLERTLHSQYVDTLEKAFGVYYRISVIRGLAFGFANAVPFFAYAATMGYGGRLVGDGELPFQNVFKVGESLILGTMMVGQAVAFAPSFQNAKLSAARVFALLDRKTAIEASPSAGLKLPHVDGQMAVQDVTFSYPSRPAAPVLRNMNFSFPPGRTVALVGASGCGKSTVLQLLLRFYEPDSGAVTLDGHELGSLNVPWLRSHLALVAQQPELFDRTIAENIAYGDNSREVAMGEIIEAARAANLHDFITALPAGYETRLGVSSSTQLSGGQKQRVAIARALLRRPAVLLLDEATSALDAQSERCVQSALDSAGRGRTCVVVAHRLSAVQGADCIAVLHRGRVAETGTHRQLMAARGLYYQLYRAQL